MSLKRILLRLWWDSPTAPMHKFLDRAWRRRQMARRRLRWQAERVAVSPDMMPGSFSLTAAEALWPGAADRSWLAAAAQRWPELHAAAASRAAAAAEDRFDLLGSGPVSVLDADGRIRWHDDFKADVSFPADCLYLDVPICLPYDGPDIKLPWELSRFQHVFAFLWTEPDRYRDVFLRQWADWLDANPVARGVNWACAMDVALRAISWTAALAAWGRTLDEPTLRRLWAALATHGHFVRDNLEWISGARTNHYFSDIVGLAVLGAVLGQYPPAMEWADFAARELDREIRQQFAPDGFNRECSTTYHCLMLELATLGWLACRVSGHDLGPAVADRLAAAYRAVAVLCDAAGHVPLIGDNDSGRVFPLAEREDGDVGHLVPLGAGLLGVRDLAGGEAPPELALLGGPGALGGVAGGGGSFVRFERVCLTADTAVAPGFTAAARGAALRDSGFFVLGNADARMVVRCGPLTYRAVGTHKHLDQLALTLSVAGRAFLVDPGQYCYTPWPEWRNRFIDSRAHNSVSVDDQPQCRFIPVSRMSYSLITEDRPRCLVWETAGDETRFVGRHSGYRRLHGGADHIRTVVYSENQRCWRVTDELPLRGHHRLTWRFCLHPDVVIDDRGDHWQLRHGGASVSLAWLGPRPPISRVEVGWYAPAYGRKTETRVVVYEAQREGPVAETFTLCVEPPR